MLFCGVHIMYFLPALPAIQDIKKKTPRMADNSKKLRNLSDLSDIICSSGMYDRKYFNVLK